MLTLEITVSSGRAEIKRFPGPVSIGRDAGDIVVDDPQVSARHAEIRITDSEVVYVDLGSTNGSFTPEGHAISRLPLSVGSTVCFGTSRITVRGLPGEDLPARHARHLGPTGTLVVDVPAPRPIEIAPGARGTFPVPGHMLRGTTEPSPSRSRRPPPGYPGLAPVIVSEPRAVVLSQLDLTRPLRVLASCWREYQHCWLPGAWTLLVALMPLALIIRLLESTLIAQPTRTHLQLGVAAVAALWLLLVGSGATHEYALRLVLGRRLTARGALEVQLARLLPMLRDTFAARAVGAVGILLCLVPGLLSSFYLFPAYLIEGRRGLELNRRSFELLQRAPRAALPTLLLATASALFVYSVATICQALPGLRQLSPLLLALATSLLVPFVLFVQYRSYFALRTLQDGQRGLERDLAARGLD